MHNTSIIKLLAASGGLLALAACSAGSTGPPSVRSVNPVDPSYSKLQASVGIVNLYGTAIGLNVVSTLRQPNGLTAVLVSTPTISGPFTLPAAADPAQADGNGALIAVGPTAAEVAANKITGSVQVAQGVTPATSTFGVSYGAFGNGLFPGNTFSTGKPASLAPGAIPFYAGGANDANTFTPWGGPPAFQPDGDPRGTRDGNFNGAIMGVSLGLAIFEGVTPGIGTYTLTATVPTGVTGTGVLSTTASIAGPSPLGPAAAPTLTFAGDGTASVSYVLPTNATGAYVEIVDAGGGACPSTQKGNSAPVYYTFWVTSSGASQVTNASSPGSATASNAICSGDAVTAQLIAFDYNQYALQYNAKLGTSYPQTPALPAQADVSLSLPTAATAP